MNRKEYHLRHYKKAKKMQGTRYEQTTLDHFVIYYLPEEHYCGYTKNLIFRIQGHKDRGKNVGGWRVLQCCDTANEALHVEAMFQSVLGIGGLNKTNIK